MQVVICADIHLGNLAKESMTDHKEAFLRVIQNVQETKASMLLIAGDLFQGDEATAETFQFVEKAFESIPDTCIFISPGNNDPATPTSLYIQETWPENVFIFTKGLEAVELTLPETEEAVRVYGMNYQSAQTVSKMLAPENFPELDPAYINILLMHGTPDPELLNGCGFDFCALGHIHNHSGIITLDQTAYAYPGACQPKGFNQEGGILIGTLGKGNYTFTFKDVASLHYREVSLDVSAIQTQDEITAQILHHFTGTNDYYRLTLTGTPAPQLRFSLAQLRNALAGTYPYMQVRARFTRDAASVQPLKSGELADYLVKEAQYTGTQQDPELVRLALEYALSVCPDSVQTPEEVYGREEFHSHED
ncbi:MAG: metallophosphoesterase [Clostridia bacterium]|nr:metallophosphoesterase [Clostridia bacterium]